MGDKSNRKQTNLYVLSQTRGDIPARADDRMVHASLVLMRDRMLDDLYQRYGLELHRYISTTFNMPHSDAEDIVQETFTKLAALEDPGEIENPRAFLYRVAHNAAIYQLKRASTRKRHVQAVQEAKESNRQENTDDFHGERVLLAEERFRILDKAIKRLPRRKRRLLIFNRIHNLSYAEIARQTGISQTQVKRLVAQALAECKRALEKSDRGEAKYIDRKAFRNGYDD